MFGRRTNWSKTNKLLSNVTKCNTLTFTLKTGSTLYDHRLEEVILGRPTTFTDLGVIFDVELSFKKTFLNASKTYGFIVQSSHRFSYDTLKLLLCTFTR